MSHGRIAISAVAVMTLLLSVVSATSRRGPRAHARFEVRRRR